MESLSAIDRVILEARSLDEIGSLGVDLLQRALGTPIVGLLLEAQAQRKRGQKIKEKQNVKDVFDGMKSWFAKNF